MPRVQQSDLGFTEPGGVLLVGNTGSGKTHFLTNYLTGKGVTERPVKNINTLDKVIWIAPRASLVQPGLARLSKHFGQHIEFLPYEECTPTGLDEKIDTHHKAGFHTAVIVDDCLCKNDRALTQFFNELAVHGRHRMAQLFVLNQRIFSGDRTRRLNCKYIVLFHFTGKSEARMLFSQLAANKDDAQRLMSAYKQIISKPYGCMILDLTGRSTKEFPCAVRDSRLDRFVPSLWDAT